MASANTRRGSHVHDFLRLNDWDVVLLNAWQNWATDLALRNWTKFQGDVSSIATRISTNTFYSDRPIRSLIRVPGVASLLWRLPSLMKRLDGVLFLANGDRTPVSMT